MQQKIRNFIPARGEIVAVKEYSRYAVNHQKTFYYHYNHLHTLMGISDVNGTITDGRRYSYDIFGEQRKSDWTRSEEDPESAGQFAGHQGITDLGLVHMGGDYTTLL